MKLITLVILLLLSKLSFGQNNCEFNITLVDHSNIATAGYVEILSLDSTVISASPLDVIGGIFTLDNCSDTVIVKITWFERETYYSEPLIPSHGKKYKMSLMKGNRLKHRVSSWTRTSSKTERAKKSSSKSTGSNCSTVQCSGRTQAGNRCKRRTTNCSGRCYQH